MEYLRTTKSEMRKLKTLALCFHHLQLKGEASLWFSHLTKEDYDKFKSHPRQWFDIDRRFQNELDYYLNSPIPETSEEPYSENIKRDSSTSLENCDISLSKSSCFESKYNFTPCFPSKKIQRDSSSSSENFHFSNLQIDKEFKHVL